MKRLIAAALTAASFQVLASPVGATAQFDTWSYKVIDLTPGDGIDPTVEFHTRADGILTSTALYADGEPVRKKVEYDASFAGGHASVVGAGGAATSILTGGPSFSAISAGFATSPRITGFTTSTQLALDYTLGAGTAIEWLGTYSVSAWTLGGDTMFDKSFAHVTFGGIENSFGVSAHGWDMPSRTLFGEASYRVDNAGLEALAHTAYFKAVATGGQVGVVVPLAPIPEPGTWALMAGGLLAVGVVARRRGAPSDPCTARQDSA